MGKYLDATLSIYSVFDTVTWKAEQIVTVPENYAGSESATFIKVFIIPRDLGVNKESVRGIVLIDIYTPAGLGVVGSLRIADKLDNYLAHKTLDVNGGSTQFMSSSVSHHGVDKALPTSHRSVYSIPFTFNRN